MATEAAHTRLGTETAVERARRGRRYLSVVAGAVSGFRRIARVGVVVGVLLAMSATTAAAATVVYVAGLWVQPATAYSNFVLGYKTFNGMDASRADAPVGIYLLTSGGSKIRVLNGIRTVTLSFPAEFSRAYCWNRATSISYQANCWYKTP